MKLYKYEKTLKAKPMMHDEAETFLGTKIPNLFYGNEGFLIQEGDGPVKWIPKSKFEKGAVIYDTEEDKIKYAINTLHKMKDDIDAYHKACKPSHNKWQKLYTCKRHLLLCADLLSKLIKIK